MEFDFELNFNKCHKLMINNIKDTYFIQLLKINHNIDHSYKYIKYDVDNRYSYCELITYSNNYNIIFHTFDHFNYLADFDFIKYSIVYYCKNLDMIKIIYFEYKVRVSHDLLIFIINLILKICYDSNSDTNIMQWLLSEYLNIESKNNIKLSQNMYKRIRNIYAYYRITDKKQFSLAELEQMFPN